MDLKKINVVILDQVARAEIIPVIILINDAVFHVNRVSQQISKRGLQLLKRSQTDSVQ